MTPPVDASDRQLCRLQLRRGGVRPGAASVKSLLNIVEMRSDSLCGHSTEIRITCLRAEYFELAGSHPKPVPARGKKSFDTTLKHKGKERRFFHEAKDFVVFSLGQYKYHNFMIFSYRRSHILLN